MIKREEFKVARHAKRTDAKVAVIGAGVIGCVYAAQLHNAGVDVTLVTRTSDALPNGIHLDSHVKYFGEQRVHVPTATIDQLPRIDVAILALQAQHLEPVLAALDDLECRIVVPLMHLGDQREALLDRIGRDRVVLAFPGIGGRRNKNGSISWMPVPQQPTLVDAKAEHADEIYELFASTGLAVKREPYMADWLNTHAILASVLRTLVLRPIGGVREAARDMELVSAASIAIRSGLLGYHKNGGRIRPPALDFLTRRMPPIVAVRYWQTQLTSELGIITIEPNAKSSANTELLVLIRQALQLVGPDAVEFREWVTPTLNAAQS